MESRWYHLLGILAGLLYDRPKGWLRSNSDGVADEASSPSATAYDWVVDKGELTTTGQEAVLKLTETNGSGMDSVVQ